MPKVEKRGEKDREKTERKKAKKKKDLHQKQREGRVSITIDIGGGKYALVKSAIQCMNEVQSWIIMELWKRKLNCEQLCK